MLLQDKRGQWGSILQNLGVSEFKAPDGGRGWWQVGRWKHELSSFPLFSSSEAIGPLESSQHPADITVSVDPAYAKSLNTWIVLQQPKGVRMGDAVGVLAF